MAEMEILEIEESTNPNKDSKVFINENGVFKQAEIDNLLRNSDTISDVNTSLTDTVKGDIFDGIVLYDGGINTTSGNDDTTANLKRTMHINVIPSSQFTLSGLSQAIRLFEYADDKSYIGTKVFGNGTFTVSSTTKYIRFHGGNEIFILPTVKCVGLFPAIRAVYDVKNTLIIQDISDTVTKSEFVSTLVLKKQGNHVFGYVRYKNIPPQTPLLDNLPKILTLRFYNVFNYATGCPVNASLWQSANQVIAYGEQSTSEYSGVIDYVCE